jgi:ABC-type sugar transport system ATPase subunit
MASALLEVEDLGKRFGGFVALDGINLSVAQGERVGLIGPNGSGKSTLVNCMCGTLQNETGTVRFDGHVVDGLAAHERTHRGMARSFQLPRPFATLTVSENLRIPPLYTVSARRGVHVSQAEIDTRCAELTGHGGGAETSDRRRGDGRPVAVGGHRHRRAADQAQRARHHHHSDRAHHARRDELLAAAGGAGVREEDRRWQA